MASIKIRIDAEHDYLTCPVCRKCVPQGHVCVGCPIKFKGPTVENVTRKKALRRKNATKPQ